MSDDPIPEQDRLAQPLCPDLDDHWRSLVSFCPRNRTSIPERVLVVYAELETMRRHKWLKDMSFEDAESLAETMRSLRAPRGDRPNFATSLLMGDDADGGTYTTLNGRTRRFGGQQ